MQAAKFYQKLFCLCQQCGFVPRNGAVGVFRGRRLIAADQELACESNGEDPNVAFCGSYGSEFQL
jgi:hypothetical protein